MMKVMVQRITKTPTPERGRDGRPPNMNKTNPNTLKALGFRLLTMCTVILINGRPRGDA
jgi:hypothetical protein